MLWKGCTQHVSKFGKQHWPQAWKRSVFIPIPKKGNAKQCLNYHTIAREIPKRISSASLTMLKALTVWITTNCGKFFQEMGMPGCLTCLLSNLLDPNLEQLSGSILGKEYKKAVYCHPAYLTCMQSTSCEMLSWMKHKLDSVCWEKHR